MCRVENRRSGGSLPVEVGVAFAAPPQSGLNRFGLPTNRGGSAPALSVSGPVRVELLCTDSSSAEKRSALFVLPGDRDSALAPFLKAALGLPTIKSDPTLRMWIVTYLLRWEHLDVLPVAEQDLFDRSVKSPFFPKSNFVLAISNLKPQISIPLLARVLQSLEPEDRLAAASFLQYTNSQTALPVLLSALDDSDKQVQFAIMQSLGNLTNQHEWRPTTIDPDSHWDACIQHWREFEARLVSSGK